MPKTIKSSTGLIIIFGAAVLIFGGAYTWANINNPNYSDDFNSTPYQTISKNNGVNSTVSNNNLILSKILPTGKSFGYVYGLDKSYQFLTFNLAEKKLETETLKTSSDLLSSSYGSAYSNNSVQWSKDGRTIAYALGDQGGMGGPSIQNSFKLMLVVDGKERTVIENSEPSQFTKWLLSPDGKSIYYIFSKTVESPSYGLYVYDIKTGKSTVAVPDVGDYATEGSGLGYLSEEKRVYMILSKEGEKRQKLHLYTFDLVSNKENETVVYDAGANNYVDSLDSTISPNGKYLFYRTTPAVGKAKLVDIETGDVQEVYSYPSNRSINNYNWSPDSKFITFVTTPYGAGDNAGEVLDLVKLNVESKEAEVLDTNTNGNGAFLNLPWSPDSKYIAYTKGKELNVYNLENKKVSNVLTADEYRVVPQGVAWIGY